MIKRMRDMAAMNDGLDRATGDYVGIVEPDDYVDIQQQLHN